MNVTGIGERNFAKLQPHIAVGGDKGEAPKAAPKAEASAKGDAR